MKGTSGSPAFSSIKSNVQSPVNTTLRQTLLAGCFQESPFWVHQALFTDNPRNGGTFLGTTLMFRGFLRKVESTQSSLQLTVASLMDVFQSVQVPTQTITPNNRDVPYFPAAPYTGGLSFFAIFPPAGFSVINPTHLQWSVGGTTAENALQDCWCSFNPALQANTGFQYRSGLPMSPAFRVRGNSDTL